MHEYSKAPSESHAEKIKQQEYESASMILDVLRSGETGVNLWSINEFAEKAYQRVEDMFSRQEFTTCKDMVMIGCGPLPMTALHVNKKFPSIRIKALDIDMQAIDVARRVLHLVRSDNIDLIHNDALSYDFGSASIIYIANLVKPKSLVLQQVALTANPETLVILRDPTQAGRAYADCGVDDIDSRFRIEGLGKDSDMFMSRHVFLRLTK